METEVQVWIETRREPGRVVVVPYARSPRDIQVDYRVDARCSSASGSSSVAQQGQVALGAGRAAGLGQLSLGNSDRMECGVEIVLRSGGREVAVQRFRLGQE